MVFLASFIVVVVSLLTATYPLESSPLEIYINGLVQDCSMSVALAMEILQSCTKPLIWIIYWEYIANSIAKYM